MQVIAATFAERSLAIQALLRIQEQFEISTDAAGVAVIGETGTPDAGLTLLAGRFADEIARPIQETLQGLGGSVVADLDEAASRLASPLADPAGTATRADLRVLDASPNAVVGVDAEGRIVYANKRVEETFGWRPGELEGQRIEVLVPPDLAERHVGLRSKYAAKPEARPMGVGRHLEACRRDGTRFPVEISLAPVETADGPVTFATVVDITVRKSLEAQLLQAQKMESVGRLAGGIAHDFNNMLFAIRGFAELMREDLEASDRELIRAELLHDLEAISTAADRATSLTSQLLAFSRRRPVQPGEVQPSDAVRAIEPMLRRLLGERIELAMNLDPATGVVEADPGQLDQILVNLAVNARDAMPDGGRLTIETGNVVFDEPYAMEHFDLQPGPYVMIAVSDTGQGMDVETRRHVFEPFFTTKEPGKGTGLGLATIYGIVRGGGGHIWLYSEPGQGTTFKIYFPRVGSTVPAPPELLDRAGHVRSGNVLLVEDEPAVRDLARRLLERAGYAVLAPDDTQTALDVIESGATVDVLVTDMVMPGLLGSDLARRAFEVRPQTGVVVLSGYGTLDEEASKLVGEGAVFVGKPLGTRELLAAIDDAIAMRRSHA